MALSDTVHGWAKQLGKAEHGFISPSQRVHGRIHRSERREMKREAKKERVEKAIAKKREMAKKMTI